MKTLEDRLSKIRREIDLLKAQESLLLDLIREKTNPPVEKKRAQRSNVKQTVIDLLTQVEANGLNAATAVVMAEDEKGVRLERGSVSSLLSRMKHEGLVTFVDGLYRLKEHSPGVEEKSGSSASVHPLRASGEKP